MIEIIAWILAGVIGLLVLLLVASAAYWAVDAISGKSVDFSCVVLHKDYTPSSTGVGPSAGGGGSGVAVTFHDEKWVLLCSVDGGEVEPIEVNRSFWVSKKVGDTFKKTFRVGGISGDRL